MRTIEREEGRGVGNGLDRGCVDVVVDVDQMPTRDVLQVQPEHDPTMTMVIGTPPQQQLQPERDPTMAMAIMTHRQQHGNRKERGPATVL